MSVVYNLTLTVVARDSHVVQLVDTQYNVTDVLSLVIIPDVQSTILIDAIHLGITSLHLRVYTYDDVILATDEYTIRVSRDSRAVDRLFNLAVLGQALFNAFALGCGTDWQRIKRHLTDNVGDFITPFMQQLVLLPPVTQLMRC